MPAEPGPTQPAAPPARRSRAAGVPGWAEPLGDWLILGGAAALFGSLFLPWSHQFSQLLLMQFRGAPILQGVPHDPTAWQVYSVADVLLALVALALVLAAVVGNHAARQVVTVVSVIALIFVIHAVSAPPTTGTLLFNPALAVPQYAPTNPGSAPGETVALLGLLAALAGLALTFWVDRAAARA
jgi:hypothetical protein